MRWPVACLAALCLLATAACGDAPQGDAPQGDAPTLDSALVDVLVDLHLADARAALDTTARDPARLRDSLRRVAYASHDLDSAGLASRLAPLADDPDQLRALYDALDSQLGLERQGIK